MADVTDTNHSDMMKLKAKHKTLHRRTQSNTAFDMNFLVANNGPNPELMNHIVQSYNILNADVTEKAIEASKKSDVDKEVIVDDINEIPNSGFVVPKINSSNNPMNFIKKRNLSMGSNLFNAAAVVNRKLDLLSNAELVGDLIGLNTIYEKRNSTDDIENAELRSSKSGDSKPASAVHSRNGSGGDSKPINIGISQPPGLQGKKPSMHNKHLSADFRPLAIENNTLNSNLTPKSGPKEANAFSKKSPDSSSTINNDYFEKKEKAISNFQKAIEKPKEFFTTSPSHIVNLAKGHKRTGSGGFAHPNQQTSNKKIDNYMNHGETKTLTKPFKTENKFVSSKSQHQVQLRPSDLKEINSKENFHHHHSPSSIVHTANIPTTQASSFTQAKSFRDVITLKNLHSKDYKEHKENKEHKDPVLNTHKPSIDNKIVNINETVKHLTEKTSDLENQIKQLCSVIQKLRQEKGELEKKVHEQDSKIQGLQKLTSKYELELSTINKKRYVSDKNHSPKLDFSGNNILNTTDISNYDSPFTDNSANMGQKDTKSKQKYSPYSTGRTSLPGSKKEDKKSSTGTIEILKKKNSQRK